MEARLAKRFWWTAGCTGCFTIGVAPILMWIVSQRFPRTLDDEGVTLRNGRRLVWRDLKPVRLISRRNPSLVFGYRFVSADGRRMEIPYASLENAERLIDFALRKTGGSA